MRVIGSVIFSLLVVPFFTLAFSIIGIPFLLLPRRYFVRFARLWTHVISFFERLLLGLHMEVRGLEHLPDEGPYIIAAKHQSTYETFKLNTLFDDAAIILKKELLLIPLWGWYLRKLDVIAIDRSSGKSAIPSVQEGAKRAAADKRPIVIFPQGTRVRLGVTTDKAPYKQGVFRAQEATGLPIIPVALNTGYFWPKGALVKKPGTVVVEFFPAIPPGLERQELLNKLENIIEPASQKLVDEATSSR